MKASHKLLAILTVAVLTFLALTCTAHAGKRTHPESWYQIQHCVDLGGKTEVTIDGVRVDCITDEYAIEYDFADKWYNGFSQALLYGELSGLKPRLVLIDEKGKSSKYLTRSKKVNKLLKDNPVKIEVIYTKDF